MSVPLATDAFPYADNADLAAASASWTNMYAAEGVVTLTAVDTNAAIPGFPGLSVYRWNACSFPNDQYAEATITDLRPNDGIGLALRCNPSALEFYYCQINAAYIFLSKMVAGIPYDLGDMSFSVWAAPVKIRMSIIGQIITVYRDDVPVLSISDPDLVSGYAGLITWNNSDTPLLSRLTAWSAGDATVQPPNSSYVERV